MGKLTLSRSRHTPRYALVMPCSRPWTTCICCFMFFNSDSNLSFSFFSFSASAPSGARDASHFSAGACVPFVATVAVCPPALLLVCVDPLGWGSFALFVALMFVLGPGHVCLSFGAFEWTPNLNEKRRALLATHTPRLSAHASYPPRALHVAATPSLLLHLSPVPYPVCVGPQKNCRIEKR